jgi:methyl-accepting chemotaxis protein
MKLGTKLYLGFSALVAIAVVLGSLAVWQMSNVKRDAVLMAKSYVPAVLVANNVERESLKTMYEIRGYAFTEETNYLDRGSANLAQVNGFLKDAKTLADSSGASLAFLSQAADKASSKVQEYEQLLTQTVSVTAALGKDVASMDKSARDFVNACESFIASQTARLTTALGATQRDPAAKPAEDSTAEAKATTVSVAEILDRVRKLTLGNEIIDVGNSIRIGNFKSQATRDPVLFQDTQKLFAGITTRLDELKSITRLDVDLKEIELCRGAAQGYNDAMTSYLKNWLAREEIGRQRTLVGNAVLSEAESVATSSADTSAKMSSTSAAAWHPLHRHDHSPSSSPAPSPCPSRPSPKPSPPAPNRPPPPPARCPPPANPSPGAPANRPPPSKKPALPSKKWPA